jgi:hypothetical protein
MTEMRRGSHRCNWQDDCRQEQDKLSSHIEHLTNRYISQHELSIDASETIKQKMQAAIDRTERHIKARNKKVLSFYDKVSSKMHRAEQTDTQEGNNSKRAKLLKVSKFKRL